MITYILFIHPHFIAKSDRFALSLSVFLLLARSLAPSLSVSLFKNFATAPPRPPSAIIVDSIAFPCPPLPEFQFFFRASPPLKENNLLLSHSLSISPTPPCHVIAFPSFLSVASLCFLFFFFTFFCFWLFLLTHCFLLSASFVVLSLCF